MSAVLQDVPRNGRTPAPFPDVPLLPAPKRCELCDTPMRLWRLNRKYPKYWQCPHCNCQRKRIGRAKVAAKRRRDAAARILTSQLLGEELWKATRTLVRLCGGWTGLRDALPPADRARLAVKLAEVAEREQARAEALERRQAEAEALLDSPALKRDLEQMALDWIRKHPTAAVRELAEAPAGKRALRKAMKDAGQEAP